MRIMFLLLALSLAAPSAAQVRVGFGEVVGERQPTDSDTFEFGFGRAVVMFDDQLVVGASGEMGLQGDVFFHRREGGAWVVTQRLAPDALLRSAIGYSLVRANGHLVAGAPMTDVAGAARAGTVHVLAFDPDAGEWSEVQAIDPPQPAEDGHFGHALAFADGTLFVGAPGEGGGRVHAYTLDDATGVWSVDATLQGDFDLAGSSFGSALATGDGRVVVGAPGEGADGEGAVYLYDHTGGAVALIERFADDSGDGHGAFGRSLSLLGDHLLVGAVTGHFGGFTALDGGAAYLLAVTPDGIVRRATLAVDDADAFGMSVLLIDARHALVGAPSEGAVYLFVDADGTHDWQPVQRVTEPVQSTFPRQGFGETLTNAADRVFIGAPAALHDMGNLPSFSKGGNLYDTPLVPPPVADLALSVHGPDEVDSASTVEVTFRVTGDRAVDVAAAFVTIRTRIPVLSAPQGCMPLRTAIHRCELGALDADTEREFTVVFQAPEFIPLDNAWSLDAFVGSERGDPDTADNDAALRVMVRPPALTAPGTGARRGGGAFGWLLVLALGLLAGVAGCLRHRAHISRHFL